jgi:hypothetical protein
VKHMCRYRWTRRGALEPTPVYLGWLDSPAHPARRCGISRQNQENTHKTMLELGEQRADPMISARKRRGDARRRHIRLGSLRRGRDRARQD